MCMNTNKTKIKNKTRENASIQNIYLLKLLNSFKTLLRHFSALLPLFIPRGGLMVSQCACLWIERSGFEPYPRTLRFVLDTRHLTLAVPLST